jgi:hypothetical protein
LATARATVRTSKPAPTPSRRRRWLAGR